MNLSSLIKTVLIAGVIQGLFVAFSLLKTSLVNKKANRVLSILLIVASCFIALFLSTVVYNYKNMRWIVFLDSLAFLFGPLIYFYFKALLSKKQETTKNILLYIAPAILHFIYGVTLFRYNDQKMYELIQLGNFKTEWIFIFTILTLTTFGYWFACFKLLIRFKKYQKVVISFKQNVRYLSLFLIALFVGNAFSVVFSLEYFFGITILPITQNYVGWIIIPCLIYIISYYLISQPETLKIDFIKEKKPTIIIDQNQLIEYKELLQKSMIEKKMYLNPQLTLNDLAIDLDIKATKLSKLINTYFGCNFYDFVNGYRIEEFVRKLRNNEHENQTLISLAYDVGFNSKTTFNKTFKKSYNSTPSEYILKLS